MSLLLLSAMVVLAGQGTTDLVTMDDFREAEIAREMLAGGDYVVPHLAGLPFVEKPPGYAVLLTGAYWVAGGPSVPAARLLTAAVALLALGAVFQLGRTLSGPVAGAAATVALATAVCFERVAHTILLDNALVAVLAWAHVMVARALREDRQPEKRRWYSAAGFLVGLSFLFKGFVGPAIFGTGALAYVVATRSWREFRTALNPWSAACFLLPVLTWVLPFLAVAPSSVVYEFFVANHLGRAFRAYASHARPVYYYVGTLWYRFAPASLVLPLALVSAWNRRNSPEARGESYLLWSALGGLLFLSLPRAKDDAYLLPVYPLLAGLVGGWLSRLLSDGSPRARLQLWGLALLSLFALGAMLVLGERVGGWSPSVALGLVILAAGAAAVVLSWRRALPGLSAWVAGGLMACSVFLFYSPPIWSWYEARKPSRPGLLEIVEASDVAELMLYRPDDRLRGAMGFYRGRTAEEVDQADALMARFRSNPGALAVVSGRPPALDEDLLSAADRAGLTLETRFRTHLGDGKPVALVGVLLR